MGRRYQNFVAPGDQEEDLDLPIPKTRWHTGRSTFIPAEHWELLVEFANKKLPEYGDLFEKASRLDGNYSNWSMEKVSEFRTALEKLCSILSESDNFTYKDIDEVYEEYLNNAYIRMIQAIIAVTDESLKLSEFFDSYVD
jgi:hypothetical protein